MEEVFLNEQKKQLIHTEGMKEAESAKSALHRVSDKIMILLCQVASSWETIVEQARLETKGFCMHKKEHFSEWFTA